MAVIAGFSATNLFASDSEAIEKIRDSAGSAKLSPEDVLAINDFVSECATRMLLAEDISQVSQIRSTISALKGTRQTQYTIEFASAVKNTLEKSFSQIATLEQGTRRTHIELNLVILAAEIEDLRLAEFGLRMIDSENSALQYWAIKTIASPQIAKQLNSIATSDPELKAKIVTALSRLIKRGLYSSSMALIVDFIEALGPKDKDASVLLHRIANRRIAEYENWTVKYELLDRNLLEQLTRCTINAGSVSKRALCAKTFAQLYSYIIQRYMIGREILSETSKQQLASVIVDTESYSIGQGKFLDRAQATIRKAVSKRKFKDLKREHDLLFGSANKAGRLASDLKFNYGIDKTGDPITAPKKLELPKNG
jgi:hypothetical protein